MAALSDYLEERLMSLVFKNNALAFASPGDQLYVALFTAGTNLEAGVLTDEVSGGAYARQQVLAAGWTLTAGQVVNAANIDFPVATASWGNVTHAAILDALTGGNVLFHGALASVKNVALNDQFRFLAGDLVASLA